jgi:hypothetical protein
MGTLGGLAVLEDYCMDDAMLTHSISTASRVILPLSGTGWPETIVVECVRETNEEEKEKTLFFGSETDQAKRRLGHHHHHHHLRIQILRVVSS